jgi:NAD(P)-dependent dehydrogenase (short-subunit alcohol dehydrogenase family)
MIEAVLPAMRARRSGAIVNISSIGARICPPGSGYYSATKAALEGMSGSLRRELQPLGITVTAVEPGAFRTDFAGRSLTQSTTVIDDYADTAGKRRKEHDTVHGTQPGDPAKAAQALITAVFRIAVGGSSRDLRLSTTVEVAAPRLPVRLDAMATLETVSRRWGRTAAAVRRSGGRGSRPGQVVLPVTEVPVFVM